MFITVDIETTFNTQRVDVFVVSPSTQHRLSSSSASAVTATKLKAKYQVHAAAILFLAHCTRWNLNKSCISRSLHSFLGL
jgi:hypothetical protein